MRRYIPLPPGTDNDNADPVLAAITIRFFWMNAGTIAAWMGFKMTRSRVL